jgi:hypothetical protein
MTETLEQELVRVAGGDRLIAAVTLAQALMTSDPKTFQAGYTKKNAVIAAAEYMRVDQQAVRAELERRMTS